MTTNRQKVLELLKKKEMGCPELSSEILADNMFSNQRDYTLTRRKLASSLNGLLHRMVKRGEIEYSHQKGPRGERMYKSKII